MANQLSFVKGLTYTLKVYNREFAEQTCILTSGVNIGGTYDNLVSSGVTYHYVKVDATSYTGDIFYDPDLRIMTGVDPENVNFQGVYKDEADIFAADNGIDDQGDLTEEWAYQNWVDGRNYVWRSDAWYNYYDDPEELDIIKIIFTPDETWTESNYYIQSGKATDLGHEIYIIDSLGDVLNEQQLYYLLGVGRTDGAKAVSHYETLFQKYLTDVIPAGVKVKEYDL